MSAPPQDRKRRIIDGKYALIRALGRGSAGTVFEAENLAVGKRVAIKLLHPELASVASVRARFVAEARAAARVAHANVVDIYDLGIAADGNSYIVMELLRGETLEEMLAARGALPPIYACELMLQVLAALSAAHACGIVHRDLKPANVVVTHPRADRPLVKVLDFGIAQGLIDRQSDRVSAGALLGTPAYIAPEQALGRRVDARADVYSAAAMLYELLSGRPPHEGANANAVLASVVRGDSIPLGERMPGLPTALTDAVDAALSYNPDQRTDSAAELAQQLMQLVAADRTASLEPPSPLCNPPSDFPPSILASLGRESLSEWELCSPQFPRAPQTPHDSAIMSALRPSEAPLAPSERARRRASTLPAPESAASQSVRALPNGKVLALSALWATLGGFVCGIAAAWAAGIL